MPTSRCLGRLLAALLPLSACQSPSADDAAARATRNPADDCAAVEAGVAAHWAAINGQDSVLVNSHHAPELTLITTEVERRFRYASPEAEAILAMIPSRTSFRVEDVDVQPYGEVAVASYYLSGGVARPDGTRDNRLRRVTEVWVRQPDDTWKEAHHHDSVFSSV